VVRGLKKSFGELRVLAGVDLDVAPGEILALVGANGAGKTTLLRILATTVIADAGEAWVGGHDIRSDSRNARRSTGFMLTEERSWYWRLTGQANLEFFAALHGLRRQAATERALRLLDQVGLADVGKRSFGTYSSGMRLRLSLARALLSGPPVLLLDEPTRSIDAEGVAHFHELLRRLSSERGTSVLMATHDRNEISEVASRAVSLHDGRLTPGGSPTNGNAPKAAALGR
jgi:ABC-2 type transport system ATP-binding protein